jgi:cysteine desulfuration protein SufE
MEIDELVDTFEFLDNWEDRYRLLIDLGRQLPAFPEAARRDEYRVEGCTSQVWLTHEVIPGPPRQLRFQADSDAFIVKGLIAIILMAYSGRSADEINATDIEGLFGRLGLEQQLSPNRRNGFFAMVERIREIALSEAA